MNSSGLLASLQTSGQRIWSNVQSLSFANLFSSRYAIAVGAQALVSGFHFILNLVLVLQISKTDYGTFAFAFVLAMFAQAINNALISTPLTVYTPVLKNPEERQQQESMLSSVNLIFCAVLVFVGLLYIPFSAIPTNIIVCIAVFVAIYAARQYSRSFGYARLRPLVPATGDVTYMVSGIIMMSLLFLLKESPGVGSILLVLAAANLFAIIVENLSLHGSEVLKKFRASVQGYNHIWQQSRWALAGAVTTLLMGQAHSLLIVQSHGPASFAPLAAGAVLFGPVRVALMTWQNMVKPEMAVALSENRTEAVRNQIRRTSILMMLALVLVGLTLAMLWPWISSLLYARNYAEEPMAWIVAAWALITLCSASYTPTSAALQALKDFRVLALGSVYASVIALISVGILLYLYSPEMTLAGILLAELFMAIFLYRVILGKLQQSPEQS